MTTARNEQKLADPFSDSETAVLHGLVNGNSYEEIAKRIVSSDSTVKMMLLRLRDRFECKTTPHLIAVLVRKRLIR